MDEKPKRLTGSSLNDFLASVGITREEPVGRSSDSGERADEAGLQQLLLRGDPLSPGPGRVAEDSDTLSRLFDAAGESACFGLTPDGHLTSHQAIAFDPDRAAAQVIRLLEANILPEDKEEALAATWLGLAYHNHDHPADFAGVVRDAGGNGQPKCCYVDVKGTRALSPAAQRTKLEQRAQERKFGCLALTVTSAANNGFAGYPGRGKPGLLVTLLHNPVLEGKTHSGYAMGWFFGISSNYQATAAVWGWGGPLGVALPEELLRRLAATSDGGSRNLLEMLAEYRDYSQFKDAQGAWDRPALRATLLAMSLAARYLFMQEDAVGHAEQTLAELQPSGIDMPLSAEDFAPGESFAVYFGRKADAAERARLLAEEEKVEAVRKVDAERKARLLAEEEKVEAVRRVDAERKARLLAEEEKLEAVRKVDAEKTARLLAEEEKLEAVRKVDAEKTARLLAEEEKLEAVRKVDAERKARLLAEEEKLEAVRKVDAERKARLLAEEEKRQAEEDARAMVVRRRQKGHTNAEIAEDLGCTEEEMLKRFPPLP